MCCVPINWKPFHVLCVCAGLFRCRTTRRRRETWNRFKVNGKTGELCLNDFYKSIAKFRTKAIFVSLLAVMCKSFSFATDRALTLLWMEKAHKMQLKGLISDLLIHNSSHCFTRRRSLFHFSFSTSLCVSACLCISAREATSMLALGRRQAEHIS